MFFIGDIHGKFSQYADLIEIFDNRPSIQLGDFGFGFHEYPDKWAEQHKFIRGNHDDPALCRQHQNYLGEYGITDEGIFYVGGGYSIDWKYRERYMEVNPNKVVWWSDEEIAESEFDNIIELYLKHKPQIVCSHDCPSDFRETMKTMKNETQYHNRTSDVLLSAMLMEHQPKIWIFGHYHESVDQSFNGTRFKCLDELEVFELEEV